MSRIKGYLPHGMHAYHRGGRFGHPWFRHRYGRGGPGPMFPDPQVMTAQACLAQVVDPSVPQNGIMGPQTRQAIRAFQMQQQMPPTGMLDSDTMGALQAACSPQVAPPPPPPPPPPQAQPPGPPPQGPKHSQGQSQPEFFLDDILNPVAGVVGSLFGGGSQPQPPPPDDGGDHWHRRHHRFGRWHHETENEFPFERPFFDFHRPDRFPDDRWRWHHDRRYWDHGEGETQAGGFGLPSPRFRRWQGQGQQQAFLEDILNPIGGIVGGLFGGGSQPQPPPPDDGGDHWHRRHHRFGRWHHETENEFPFERPFFDFHRPDRFPDDRWRWDHDRRYWDHAEGETHAEKPEGQRRAGAPAASGGGAARPAASGGSTSRPAASGGGVAQPAASGGDVARPIVDRPIVERTVIERPVIERPVIERPVIERPIIERPVFARPPFARPGFARPGFDFHARDRFPFARDRWNWNRDRFRWFGRPWGRRDGGFGFFGRGPQVAWAQSCLAQVLGPWVVQDGIMGPATQGAIRTFQQQQQLAATGFLDGPTVNALQAACGSQMP